MVRKTKEETLETRNAILDAAELVFQDKGVSSTSLADIALAAGVTRGAIYWHFKDKADLFDAMIERIFEPVESRMAELEGEFVGDPVAALCSLALFFLGRIANDDHYFRLIEISWHKCEYVGEMARIRDDHLECGTRYLAISERAFALARERGLLPATASPHCAAVGLVAIVDGLVVNWTLNREQFPLEEYAPKLIGIFLDGLGYQPKP